MDYDIMNRFSNGQVITTDIVSDVVLGFGSDAKRNVWMGGLTIIKALVTVIAAGGTEGIRIEARYDTAAGLASGSQIVVGDSGILLPAQLEAVGVLHQFRLRPVELPAGYDFFGIFYDVVTSAFSGGFALRTWLAQYPENAPAPM